MSDVAIWSLVIGTTFLVSALARGPMRRWPLSMPLVYLGVGIGIGPWGLGLLSLHAVEDAKTIEVLAEIAVLVSLLTAGLRLAPRWSLYRSGPVPLATAAMLLTVAGITAAGMAWLALPLGAAILLGAVLAPTDPVLATEVQVRHENDRDRLRYALTGEAGLNDGTAFPFVMLGLGLLGLHELGAGGWRWVAVDLAWATAAGLGSGWLLGSGAARLLGLIERRTGNAVAHTELLILGLIGISYGTAMAIAAYGFLAVFAAGVALRFHSSSPSPKTASSATVATVAEVNDQFERLLEAGLVVVIGVLVSSHADAMGTWWLPALLFVLIRPLAVYASLIGQPLDARQKRLVAFFGVRGVGSVYYLAFAFSLGLDGPLAETLAGLVLTTIVASLLVHGSIASLVIDRYARAGARADQPAAGD